MSLSLDTALQVCSPCDFGPSLSACPKLEHFMSYKLSGLRLRGRSAHKLSLPKCAFLGLWRAYSLNRIEIEAPKLEHLDLQVLEVLPSVSCLCCLPSQAPHRTCCP